MTEQYRQDLREGWMFNEDKDIRHEKSKQFAGRVAELQFAEYLETQGWTVSGLEALRKGPDIEASARDGQPVAFEVKFIGIEKDDFAEIVKSLRGEPSGDSVSVPDAANYLLFRVYEAAKQLQRSSSDRIAVVIVDDVAWSRFSLLLHTNRIKWTDPRFLPGSTTGEVFLASQQDRYPDFQNNIQPALKCLKAVWIFTRSGDHRLHCKFEVLFDRV